MSCCFGFLDQVPVFGNDILNWRISGVMCGNAIKSFTIIGFRVIWYAQSECRVGVCGGVSL